MAGPNVSQIAIAIEEAGGKLVVNCVGDYAVLL